MSSSLLPTDTGAEEKPAEFLSLEALIYFGRDSDDFKTVAAIAEEAAAFIRDSASGYIWHVQPLVLQTILPDEQEGRLRRLTRPAILTRLRVDDNVEDEWFATWLLCELTKRFASAGAVAQISDNESEFLLVQAAEYLPRWVERCESMENRVYVAAGALHLVPPSAVPGLPTAEEGAEWVRSHITESRASDAIQATLQARLGAYPGRAKRLMHVARALLPARAAAVLAAHPQVVSAAVDAFCSRDSSEVMRASRLRFFPPWRDEQSPAAPASADAAAPSASSSAVSPSASTARVSALVPMSVPMTRHLYAQLVGQGFAPPRHYAPFMPPRPRPTMPPSTSAPASAVATEAAAVAAVASTDAFDAAAAWAAADLGCKLAAGLEILMLRGKGAALYEALQRQAALAAAAAAESTGQAGSSPAAELVGSSSVLPSSASATAAAAPAGPAVPSRDSAQFAQYVAVLARRGFFESARSPEQREAQLDRAYAYFQAQRAATPSTSTSPAIAPSALPSATVESAAVPAEAGAALGSSRLSIDVSDIISGRADAETEAGVEAAIAAGGGKGGDGRKTASKAATAVGMLGLSSDPSARSQRAAAGAGASALSLTEQASRQVARLLLRLQPLFSRPIAAGASIVDPSTGGAGSSAAPALHLPFAWPPAAQRNDSDAWLDGFEGDLDEGDHVVGEGIAGPAPGGAAATAPAAFVASDSTDEVKSGLAVESAAAAVGPTSADATAASAAARRIAALHREMDAAFGATASGSSSASKTVGPSDGSKASKAGGARANSAGSGAAASDEPRDSDISELRSLLRQLADFVKAPSSFEGAEPRSKGKGKGKDKRSGEKDGKGILGRMFEGNNDDNDDDGKGSSDNSDDDDVDDDDGESSDSSDSDGDDDAEDKAMRAPASSSTAAVASKPTAAATRADTTASSVAPAATVKPRFDVADFMRSYRAFLASSQATSAATPPGASAFAGSTAVVAAAEYGGGHDHQYDGDDDDDDEMVSLSGLSEDDSEPPSVDDREGGTAAASRTGPDGRFVRFAEASGGGSDGGDADAGPSGADSDSTAAEARELRALQSSIRGYMAAMEAELMGSDSTGAGAGGSHGADGGEDNDPDRFISTLAASFARLPTPAAAEAAADARGGPAAASSGRAGPMSAADVTYNLLSSLAASVAGQGGRAGPVSNLVGHLGLHVPEPWWRGDAEEDGGDGKAREGKGEGKARDGEKDSDAGPGSRQTTVTAAQLPGSASAAARQTASATVPAAGAATKSAAAATGAAAAPPAAAGVVKAGVALPAGASVTPAATQPAAEASETAAEKRARLIKSLQEWD